MKISELIDKLTDAKEEHGDVECEAFQHPEEEEMIQNISSLYYSPDDKTLTIT